jgi:hypothetical protein
MELYYAIILKILIHTRTYHRHSILFLTTQLLDVFCDAGIATQLVGWNDISSTSPRQILEKTGIKMARAFNAGWTEIILGTKLVSADESINAFLAIFMERLNSERQTFIDRTAILKDVFTPLNLSTDIMELRERRRFSNRSSSVAMNSAKVDPDSISIVETSAGISIVASMHGSTSDSDTDHPKRSTSIGCTSIPSSERYPTNVSNFSSISSMERNRMPSSIERYLSKTPSPARLTQSTSNRTESLKFDASFSSTPPKSANSLPRMDPPVIPSLTIDTSFSSSSIPPKSANSLPRIGDPPFIPQTSKSLNRPRRASIQPPSLHERRDTNPLIPPFFETTVETIVDTSDDANDALSFKKILDEYSLSQRPIYVPSINDGGSEFQFNENVSVRRYSQCSSLPDRYPKGGVSITELVARMTSAKVCDLEFTRVFLMLYPRWMSGIEFWDMLMARFDGVEVLGGNADPVQLRLVNSLVNFA